VVLVVEDVLKRLSRVRLPLGVVIQVDLLVKQDLKAGMGKGQVDECIIVKSDAHQRANQLEIDVRLERLPVEPV